MAKKNDQGGLRGAGASACRESREGADFQWNWYRKVFECAPIAIALYDAAGNLLEINAAAADLFGIRDAGAIRHLNLLENMTIPSDIVDRLKCGDAVEYCTSYDFDEIRRSGLFQTSRSGAIYLHVMIRPFMSDEAAAHPFYIAQVQEVTAERNATQQLVREKRNFSGILDAMADGVLVINADYTISYANPAMVEMFGDIGRRPCYRYLHGKDRPCGFCKNEEVFKGNTLVWEHYFPYFDKTFHLMDSPIRNADGRMAKLEIFRDITALKKAEKRLQRSHAELEATVQARTTDLRRANEALAEEVRQRREKEYQLHEQNEFLESMFSSIHFLIAYMDREFNFIRVNRAYAEADGQTPGDFIGKNHFDLFPHEENEAIFRRVVETGEPYFAHEKPFSYAYNPERGVTYWDWTLHPVKDINGRTSGVILVLVDVTERKKAQDARRQAEKHIRVMTEAMDDVFWMVTADRKQLLYISPSYEAMWGRSCESLYRDPDSFLAAIHPEDRPGIEEAVRHNRASTWDRAYRICRPDGTVRWVRDRGFPVTDDQNTLQMIAGVATDITERKTAELSLQRSEARVRQLSAELLDAQEKERKHLAQEIHDSLGSGLTAIKLSLENKMAEVSGQAGSRTRIENILDMAQRAIDECKRLQKGLRPPLLDDMGLLYTIDWQCQQTGGLYPDICIERDFDIEEADIASDQKIVIYRVLQEALNNVIKHSGCSWVRVSLVKKEGRIRLTVADNGVGFDPDAAGAFDSRGVLGMRERVELTGGHFFVQSARNGGGTTLCATWQATV